MCNWSISLGLLESLALSHSPLQLCHTTVTLKARRASFMADSREVKESTFVILQLRYPLF